MISRTFYKTTKRASYDLFRRNVASLQRCVPFHPSPLHSLARTTNCGHVIANTLGVSRTFSTAPSLDLGDLIITPRAAKRLKHIQEVDGKTRLRVSVDGGGCSGFQYVFELTKDELGPDDVVFEKDGVEVVVDEVSMEFLRGATIEYEEEIIRAGFEVINNPNADSGCGCGVSFAPRD